MRLKNSFVVSQSKMVAWNVFGLERTRMFAKAMIFTPEGPRQVFIHPGYQGSTGWAYRNFDLS